MPIGAAIRNTGTLVVICAGGVHAERKRSAPYHLCCAAWSSCSAFRVCPMETIGLENCSDRMIREVSLRPSGKTYRR